MLAYECLTTRPPRGCRAQGGTRPGHVNLFQSLSFRASFSSSRSLTLPLLLAAFRTVIFLFVGWWFDFFLCMQHQTMDISRLARSQVEWCTFLPLVYIYWFSVLVVVFECKLPRGWRVRSERARENRSGAISSDKSARQFGGKRVSGCSSGLLGRFIWIVIDIYLKASSGVRTLDICDSRRWASPRLTISLIKKK